MRQKKKLVIFQSDPHLEQLSWQDMAEQWKCELGKYPDEIGAYRILLMKGSLQADSFREEIGDADAVLGPGIHPGLVNETFFRLHPNVKYIATLDHGYREFDRDITKKYGVTVTNTIYGDRTIAQYAMALLLNICHDVSRNSHFTKKEYWEKRSRSEDVNYFSVMTPQIELFGKTLGIVGLGKIGSRMAEMALGMGMKVIACRRTGKSGASPAKPGDSLKIAGGSLEQVSFGELLERLQATFGTKAIRYSGDKEKIVSRVALCGGSGAFLTGDAIAAGADIYITGDLKYHDFTTFAGQIALADIGHYESEQCAKEIFGGILRERFPQLPVVMAETDINPINYHI